MYVMKCKFNNCDPLWQNPTLVGIKIFVNNGKSLLQRHALLPSRPQNLQIVVFEITKRVTFRCVLLWYFDVIPNSAGGKRKQKMCSFQIWIYKVEHLTIDH